MKVKDMTVGSPTKLIFFFSLPMFFGSLFLQFYNIADSIIVGRFLGMEAFAAVGSCFAVMVLINSVIMGMSLGAGTIFSQLYGDGDYAKLKKAIIMAVIFILGVSLTLSILLLVFCRPILVLYKMPPEIMAFAYDYLVCIFSGIIFLGIYSIVANIMRALGDSKTPIYFLIVSCFVNMGLDLVFIVYFKMGTFGAALATVVAQIISAIWGSIYLIAKLRFLSFSRTDFRFDKELFLKLLNYSLLTSVHQSIMNFGILLVQRLVNTFDPVVMAAFTAGVKVDAFAYIPLQELGNAAAIYTAQNMGAKKYDRIRAGIKSTITIITAFSIPISVLVVVFSRPLISIFLKDTDIGVINVGARYLLIEGSFYMLIGYLFMFYGFFRSIGRNDISILLTVVSLGIRVLMSYSLAPVLGYHPIFWSIPLGWLFADMIGLVLYRKHWRMFASNTEEMHSV